MLCSQWHGSSSQRGVYPTPQEEHQKGVVPPLPLNIDFNIQLSWSTQNLQPKGKATPPWGWQRTKTTGLVSFAMCCTADLPKSTRYFLSFWVPFQSFCAFLFIAGGCGGGARTLETAFPTLPCQLCSGSFCQCQGTCTRVGGGKKQDRSLSYCFWLQHREPWKTSGKVTSYASNSRQVQVAGDCSRSQGATGSWLGF